MPWWLLWHRYWGIGVLVLIAASVLAVFVPPVVAIIIAILMSIIVFVPFIGLLVIIITDPTLCRRISPGYLFYTFLALQTAHALTFWAEFRGNPGSFTLTCTGACDWYEFLRLFYLAAMTFTSVGYGDVTPVSWFATVLAIFSFWTPVFYLGVLFDRLVAARLGQ